jgi:hypothetical protein
MRWSSDRSGAAECLAGELVAGGIGGDTTQQEAAGKRNPANSDEPLAEVEARPDCLTVLAFFAGIS